ncbi:DUF1127 domain-containing protein [Microvirga flavescens]|uniref:DUF1127 domain-containing protein n=1 Tax=Microvirga flavescens TaxID=2249811 RepID=UPI000DD54BBB|nr:DUF1127 domain-containing protein [Microvirga flavescens]
MHVSSTETLVVSKTSSPAFLRNAWQWLRRARAIRRTQLAVSDLSESQLRDIGLVGDDPAMIPDSHQRYWQEALGFSLIRRE